MNDDIISKVKKFLLNESSYIHSLANVVAELSRFGLKANKPKIDKFYSAFRDDKRFNITLKTDVDLNIKQLKSHFKSLGYSYVDVKKENLHLFYIADNNTHENKFSHVNKFTLSKKPTEVLSRDRKKEYACHVYAHRTAKV